jgi:hypothetical protein
MSPRAKTKRLTASESPVQRFNNRTKYCFRGFQSLAKETNPLMRAV